VRVFNILCCLFAVLICGAGPSRADPRVFVPRIMDADTVDAGTFKIRLNGIDARKQISAALTRRARSGVVALRRRPNLTPIAIVAPGAANSRVWTGMVAHLARV
jgi:hypothetical protein